MGIDTPWVVLRLFYPNAKLPSSDKRQEHRQQVFRHFFRMKSRIFLSVLLILLLISVSAIWFFRRADIESPAQVFPATVERDCAPWDGSAFTVSIPWRDGSSVSISMYRSPDIKLPSRYSFPDEAMSEGNVYLRMPEGSLATLTGDVWFQRVAEGMPVEGSFQLTSESEAQFQGKFFAEWGEAIVYCG
jgi:hypothetical protein